MWIWAFLGSCIVVSGGFFLFQRTGSTSIQTALVAGGPIMGSATVCCLEQKEPGRSLQRPATLEEQTSPAFALYLKLKCFSTFWRIVRMLWAKICLFLKVLGFGYVIAVLCADSGDSTEFWIGLWKRESSPTVEWSNGSPVTLTLWHQYHPPHNQTGRLCAKADRKVFLHCDSWTEDLSCPI